jgi:hypothetical protein
MPFGPASGGIEEDTKVLLIDDFSRTDGRSALGTEWQTFTDHVMGGVSQGSAVRDTVAQRPRLFPTDGQWRQIDPPFTASGRENLRAALDPSRIERIGGVAAKKAFTDDVAVAQLACYR